jgi:hypothetical protein
MRRTNRTRMLIDVFDSQLDRPPTWGAEIGVWRGENAYGLMTYYKHLTMYLVDNYDPELVGKGDLDPDDIEDAESDRYERLKDFVDLGRTVDIYEPSDEAYQYVPHRLLDFVFIDACHDYNSVHRDIGFWMPKIRKGGIIAGHDFGEFFPGVEKAVTAFFGNVMTRRSVWWKQL